MENLSNLQYKNSIIENHWGTKVPSAIQGNVGALMCMWMDVHVSMKYNRLLLAYDRWL